MREFQSTKLRDFPKKTNMLRHFLDGGSFQIGMSMATVGVVMPAFVARSTSVPFLIALIPLIYDLLGSIAQPLSAWSMGKDPEARPIRRYFLFALFNRASLLLMGVAVLAFGNLPWLALTLFYLFLGSYSLLMGFCGPWWIRLIGMTVPDPLRHKFMSTRDFAGRTAGILASLSVPFVLAFSPYPANYGLLFLIAGAAQVLGILPAASFSPLPGAIKEVRRAPESFIAFIKAGFAAIRTNPSLWSFLILYWGLSLSRLGAAFFTPRIMQSALRGLSDAEYGAKLGALNLLLLVCMALSALLMGRVLSRVGHRALIIAGAIALAAGNALVVFVPTYPAALAATALIAFFNVAGYFPSLQAVMDLTPPDSRPMVNSLANVTNAFSCMAFSLLGSVLAGFAGFAGALATSGAAALGLAGFGIVLARKTRRGART